MSRRVMRTAAPEFDRENANEFSVGVDFGGTNLRVAAYSPKDGVLETVQQTTRLKDGRDEHTPPATGGHYAAIAGR